MINVLLTAVAALALVALPPAHGADRYAGVAAGVWIPDTSGNIKTELDNGLAGELRAGWRFAGGFILEAGAGALHAEHTLPPVDVTETTLHALSAWYLLLSAKADLPLGDGTWRIGAGAGLGHYSASLDAKHPPATERSASESDTGFHLGVSLRLAVTEHAGLSLEYREVRASPGDVDIDGAAVLLAGDYHY